MKAFYLSSETNQKKFETWFCRQKTGKDDTVDIRSQVDLGESEENRGIRGNFAFLPKPNNHLPSESFSMILTLN